MGGRKFLQRIPLATARELVVENAPRLEAEVVAAESSLGRSAAGPVVARRSSPHYRASAMDGFAVRAADTAPADAETAVALRLLSGEVEQQGDPGDGAVCAAVDTGSAMPAWSDAVIRVEDAERHGEEVVIRAPVSPGRDVRAIGEDVEDGTMLFGSGHVVRPFDIGSMLASGVDDLAVVRRPRVAVLATGGEVVEPGGNPEAGQVVEYNSRILTGFVSEWGGECRYLGRVADQPAELAERLREAAADNDIVCVIAGSSAGSKDVTVGVLDSLGEVLFHGVDMMPGKPAALAVVDETPVVGIPGYPVSAVVAYQQLVRPLVAAALCSAEPVPAIANAEVRRPIVSRLGVEEFVRVCLAGDGATLIAAPLPRGAGSVSTLVRADAILRIGANREGIDAGEQVEVELLRPLGEIGRTIVVAGRPNPLTSALAEALCDDASSASNHGARVAHLGLGDYDALAALASGECHVAAFASPVPRRGHGRPNGGPNGAACAARELRMRGPRPQRRSSDRGRRLCALRRGLVRPGRPGDGCVRAVKARFESGGWNGR